MINNIDENEYLSKIINLIKTKLSCFDGELLNFKQYIRDQRKRTWEDYMHASPEIDDIQGLIQVMETEHHDIQKYERILKQHSTLKILESSPYFARLDITEDGETESIYLGKSSLIDNETSDVLICDWRSDIASIFYDSDLGETSYNTSLGIQKCYLELKRQYKIINEKLIYMFDTNIAIQDEILQKELASTSDNKLKTIISTIQKEQSVAIRDIKSDVLIVQGVAGSGKTSIALHRLAYLLYKNKSNLSSKSIIIFSPNNIFNTYIEDILPDLGENKVQQTSLSDYIGSCFSDYNVFDNAYEADLIFDNKISCDYIKYKQSLEIKNDIDSYFPNYIINNLHFDDIKYYDKIIRNSDSVKYLYFTEYASYLPEVRTKKIIQGIVDILNTDFQYKKSHENAYKNIITDGGVIGYSDEELEIEINKLWNADIENIKEKIKTMLSINVIKIYLDILKTKSSQIYNFTKKYLDSQTILYEDLSALSYIAFLSGKLPCQQKIKHVLIDEVQDYSPLNIYLLSKLFTNAKFTLVGDVNQSFIKYYNCLNDLNSFFINKNINNINLTKSYRSTLEINKYISSKIFNEQQFNNNEEFFNRHGQSVDIINKKNIYDYLINNKNNNLLTALICKTTENCIELKNEIESYGLKLDIISSNDIIKPGSMFIIPSYLAKGLEFDCVIISDNTYKEWIGDREQRAWYVSASRALHKLVVYK